MSEKEALQLLAGPQIWVVDLDILIFGGSGFLGGRLVPILKNLGHKVCAPRSSELDLTQPNNDLSGLGRPDVVIHAAALYGGMPFDMEHQANIFTTNMRMNVNALEVAARLGAERIISVGSACAYPGESDHDFGEDEVFDGPLHPSVECHGFTKRALIIGHRCYWESHGQKALHLLPANLYGPGDVYQEERAHVVAALIKKFTDAEQAGLDVALLGDGSPVREFMFIDDLARAIAAACTAEFDGVELVNVGTGTGTTIRDLANKISALIGFRGAVSWAGSASNGALRKVMKVDRSVELLGLDSATTLDDGLRQTLDWYLPNKAQADARE